MSASLVLLPNLGAEEGGRWRRSLRLAPVRLAARLWSGLFARGAELLELPGEALDWPAALESDAAHAAFEFLEIEGPALVPWLSTDEAASLARARGVPLHAPAPDVVARVHDKAFAQREAERAGRVPAELLGQVRVFEPADLADADAALAAIRGALESWPESASERFVLKPRLGTSGRGRVAGLRERPDGEELRAALPRLVRRGGALLEPWLERREDLSAQLLVSRDGDVRLLGTLRQVVTPSGVPTGMRAQVGADGELRSGSAHDPELRAAAAELAGAARDAGFHGVCGLDALVFAAPDGREVARPVVELNARFTLGTVAVGLFERARRCGALAPGDGAELVLGPSDAAPAGVRRIELGDAALKLGRGDAEA